MNEQGRVESGAAFESLKTYIAKRSAHNLCKNELS